VTTLEPLPERLGERALNRRERALLLRLRALCRKEPARKRGQAQSAVGKKDVKVKRLGVSTRKFLGKEEEMADAQRAKSLY